MDPALPDGGLYSVPTSIFLAEVLKLVISLAMGYTSLLRNRASRQYEALESQEGRDNAGEKEDKEERSSTSTPPRLGALQALKGEVLASDCWKLGVPAALYVAQNLLQMAAITAVSAVTYQAVTQLKVLTTTLLSTWLLSRSYSRAQWLSILAVVAGVVLVSSSKIRGERQAGRADQEDAFVIARLVGVLATLLACTLGSGAAVYMEAVLKSDRQTSLWIRNAQLSLWSLIPATAAVLYDASQHGSWDPLRFFGSWAWLTVLARSLGGFLIALILKQTDALLKGIATSVAMVLSILIESLLFDIAVGPAFAAGATLVLVSSATYVKCAK